MIWRYFKSYVLVCVLLLAVLPAARPAFAAEMVVDNSDGAVQVKGQWTSTKATAGFYGADYLYRTPGDGSSSVTWPFPSSAASGRYAVFAQWSSGPNRASNAAYQVTSAAGASNVAVSQKANGGGWQQLGTFDFVPVKGQGVILTDKADGVVVADAVRFVGPQDSASAAASTSASPQTAAVVSPPASPPPSAQTTPTPAQASSAPAPTAQPQPAPTPAPQATGATAPVSTTNDARYFTQTGYRIGEDAFWNYFQARGGARTFGYPVSNAFFLYGAKVQIFQRQIMQLRADGGVQTMNLLDDGLLPYTRMNGSTFPAADPSITSQAPTPDDPNYLSKAMDFVRATAPDTFDGQPVNFSRTFFNSVTARDAYPNGVPAGGDTLVQYFNLEIWGLPTSKPAHDPNNPDFIYQRFQRGIMHYDKSCGCTQGLLLADYVKALMTGQNLPGDLGDQAKSSKLVNQFKPSASQWLARPADLPGSDLTNAFANPGRNPIVTLDPGHGGTEIGTSHTFPDGSVITEKDLNLRVVLRVRDLLQQAGYQVVTTRTTDAQVNADKKDLTGDGKSTLSDDLQARIDIANKGGSDIFVSIHFNGVSDTSTQGTYVFYDPDRPFTDRSKALADLVDASLIKFMKDAGYSSVDHGAAKDTSVLAGDHYYVLSPKTSIVQRPSGMPAIIGEGLFLTNDADATAVKNNAIVEAIAQGYVAGIKAYFARYPAT